MAEIDDQPFPRGMLIGAGALVAVALVAVGAVRLGLIESPAADRAESTATPAASRDLRFVDRADGAVVVERAEGGVAAVIEPGTGGFVRGVVRGLARERRARGVGREPAFRLTRWSDGRLTLADPATGRTLALDGFGVTNKQAFADLLTAAGDRA